MNLGAVIVAAIAGMVIGGIWYAPPVFGKTWMQLVGITPEDAKKGRAKGFGGMIVLALVLAFAMSSVFDSANVQGVGEGLQTAFWLWLGFVVTTNAGDVLFAKKPAKLYWINVSYYLVEFFVMGWILAAWA